MAKVKCDTQNPTKLINECQKQLKIAAHDLKGIAMSGFDDNRVAACEECAYRVYRLLSEWRQEHWKARRLEREKQQLDEFGKEAANGSHDASG